MRAVGVALGAAVAVATVGAVLLAAFIAAAGGSRVLPVEVLAAAALFLVAWPVLMGVAAPLTGGRPTRARLGLLREPLDREAASAAAMCAAGALVVVVLAAVLHPFGHLPVPRELSHEPQLLRAAGVGDADRVPFGAGLLASGLARGTALPLAEALVLIGVALPALHDRYGTARALASLALAGGIAGAALGSGGLFLPGAAIGALAALSFLTTGTIVFAAGIAAVAQGALFGAACHLGLGGVAGFALGCGSLALAAAFAAAAEPDEHWD